MDIVLLQFALQMTALPKANGEINDLNIFHSLFDLIQFYFILLSTKKWYDNGVSYWITDYAS